MSTNNERVLYKQQLILKDAGEEVLIADGVIVERAVMLKRDEADALDKNDPRILLYRLDHEQSFVSQYIEVRWVRVGK